MAVGVGIADIGSTSTANTNDLFILGVRSETVDGNGATIVSYDTQGITFGDLQSSTPFIDLTDLSTIEVEATVYNDAGGIAYDNTTGAFTLTKPYLRSNTEIWALISASDAKITVVNGVIGLGSVSTTDISEGDKLFYTNARATSAARSAISVSGTLVYNSSTGVVSYTERTDSEIRELISGGLGVSYDESNGEISIPQEIGTSSSVTFGDITAPSLYTAPGNESTGGIFITDNAIKFANRSGGSGNNWVGVINQWNSQSYQRLDIGAGDGLTSSGVVPQGAFSSYYGPQDVNHPNEIINNVRDGSIQKEAGGWYSNGQFHAEYSATIGTDLTVGGIVFAELQGQASTVASLGNFDTNNLSEGSTNQYFTNARVVSALSGANTDNLSEGNNLYHTNARVDARIAAADIGDIGNVDASNPVDGAVLSYNNSSNEWQAVASKDNLPLGTIQWYAGQADNIPAGWLECDGSQITATYPTLRQFLIDNSLPYGQSGGNPLLPDLRGRFARGYHPSSSIGNSPYVTAVGASQADAYKRHTHPAGTLETSEAGLHTHTVKGNDGGKNGAQLTAPFIRNDDAETLATDPQSIQAAGNHTHTLTGSTGDSPPTTISYPGLETRPTNISFVPIIKAWGSLLNTANLGQADIAGLVDNIASQSQAQTGTDNTHFMSPLRTKQAITQNLNTTVKAWSKYSTTTPSVLGWVNGTHYHISGQSIDTRTNTSFSHKRVYNDTLDIKTVRSGGYVIGKHEAVWFDLGKMLYDYPDNQDMTMDDMPDSWNITFKMNANKHGLLSGDELIIDNSWYGNNYGTGFWFQLSDVNGVTRLLFRMKTDGYASLQKAANNSNSYIKPEDGTFNLYFTKHSSF
tara:strand:+ start:599 stop:3178 length:2580 start_codon:yes stop_codon:yes gene_type:complete